MIRTLRYRIVGTVAIVALPVLAVWLRSYEFIPIPGSDVGGTWAIVGSIGLAGFLLGFLWRSPWPFAILAVVWVAYSVAGTSISTADGRGGAELSVPIAAILGFMPAVAGAGIGALVGYSIEQRRTARR